VCVGGCRCLVRGTRHRQLILLLGTCVLGLSTNPFYKCLQHLQQNKHQGHHQVRLDTTYSSTRVEHQMQLSQPYSRALWMSCGPHMTSANACRFRVAFWHLNWCCPDGHAMAMRRQQTLCKASVPGANCCRGGGLNPRKPTGSA
jgi:hypothetical protein